jgi:hypothetical protein
MSSAGSGVNTNSYMVIMKGLRVALEYRRGSVESWQRSEMETRVVGSADSWSSVNPML